jgi:hypothetical protein
MACSKPRPSLDEAGLAEMRKGNAATVRNGPYEGDQLSVDTSTAQRGGAAALGIRRLHPKLFFCSFSML